MICPMCKNEMTKYDGVDAYRCDHCPNFTQYFGPNYYLTLRNQYYVFGQFHSVKGFERLCDLKVFL